MPCATRCAPAKKSRCRHSAEALPTRYGKDGPALPRYSDTAAEALTTHIDSDLLRPRAVARFLDRIDYAALDATAGFGTPAAAVGGSVDLSIFPSTAPSLFEAMIAGLAGSGPVGG